MDNMDKMDKLIKGKVYKFGDNIDTDQIYPGRYLELTEPEDIKQHALEGVDPTFVERFTSGGIIVAGSNFGCGSSREHAAITLKSLGVNLIIAESIARIFYRNCINLGLPLMICKNIYSSVDEEDELQVDLKQGSVINNSSGMELAGEPLSDYVMNILESGGIKTLLKQKADEINNV